MSKKSEKAAAREREAYRRSIARSSNSNILPAADRNKYLGVEKDALKGRSPKPKKQRG